MTVHRPPIADRPSVRTTGKPTLTLTLLASLGAQAKTNCTSMLWSIDSYQNRASADHYHLTVSRAQVSTQRVWVFFEVIRWQITTLKWSWSQAQVYFFPRIHIKYVVFMSLWPRTIRIFISNWPQNQKFNQFFKSIGGEDLILPWSRVGHALRPIFVLWLVKIWQESSSGKIMQHLESCLLWQLKLTEFCVNLWCF